MINTIKIPLFIIVSSVNTAFVTSATQTQDFTQVKSNVLQYMQTWQIEDDSTRQLHLRKVAIESFTYKDPTSSDLVVVIISKLQLEVLYYSI